MPPKRRATKKRNNTRDTAESGRAAQEQRRNRTLNRTPKKGRDWRPLFLRDLETWGNVSRACKRAGVARATAYESKDSDPAFRAAWTDALDCACDAMEEEAHRRAVVGTEKPVYQAGRLVGRVREYSDTLLIFMLKAHRPEKFRENIRSENWNIGVSQLSDTQLEALGRGGPVPQVLAMGHGAA